MPNNTKAPTWQATLPFINTNNIVPIYFKPNIVWLTIKTAKKYIECIAKSP